MSGDDREKQPANELATYLRALWSRRWWIVAGTVLCLMVASVSLVMQQRQYRATARLAVSRFRVGDMQNAPPNLGTYVQLIRSQTIAQQLVDQYGFDEPPNEMTALDLLELLSVHLVPGTWIVELSVLLPDPQAALDVCSQFAINAEELARTVNQKDFVRAQSMLESELEAADVAVASVENELASLGGDAAIRALNSELDIYLNRRHEIETRWLDLVLLAREQEVNRVDERVTALQDARLQLVTERMPEALDSRLEATLEQLNEFQAELARVEVSLETERVILEKLSAVLAEQERIIELQRTLSDEVLMAQLARRDRDQQTGPVRLTSEYVNPVYESIEESVARSRASIGGLEQEKSELEAQIEVFESRTEALEQQLASTTRELEEFDRRLELATDEHAELYARAPAGISATLVVFETQLAETSTSIVETQAELGTRAAQLQRVSSEYASALQIRSDLARRLEQSEINVAGQLAELVIVDDPILPTRPASPRIMLTLVSSMAVGFLISLLLATVAAALEASALRSDA